MSETSDDGRVALKAALVSKIMQLMMADHEVSEASYRMRWAVHSTCLPDIIRDHVISAIKSNQIAVAAMVELQIIQLKDVAAANGVLIDDRTMVEATRGDDEQPDIADLPPQDAAPIPDGPPFFEAEESAAMEAVTIKKPAKRSKTKRKNQRKAS